jgi:small subunit ribosomal protein S6
MVRTYEAVYIFDSVLEEADITAKLEKYHALIPQSGEGATVAVDHWGKRTLAYPIAKRETGYYVVAKFEATGEMQLLRHLIVLDEGAQMSTVPTSKDEEEE